jgi:hypothetical protein
VDRLDELWNGPYEEKKQQRNQQSNHTISQSDYMNNSMAQNDMFPPAPVVTSNNSQANSSYTQSPSSAMDMGPMPANNIGSSFGAYY